MFRHLCARPWPGLHATTLRSPYRSLPSLARVTGPSGTPVRHASLEAGENKTGHLQDGPDKALFYFDNVYPLRLTWLFKLPWHAESTVPHFIDKFQSPSTSKTNPVNIIKDAKTPATISEVVPRVKEGGMFVRFELTENTAATDIEDAIRKYLKDARIKPWWNPFLRMRARLVHGKPWIEDMFRLPCNIIRIDFLPADPGEAAAELGQEQLYELFRPYGKILDIMPQPFDSKVMPKYAQVEFATVRRAAMAKNCLHGYVVSANHGGGKAGTILRIGYEQRQKTNWIKDWLFSHPRIVIPILAALAAGITVMIFDPIRTFFIKTHIKQNFNFTNSRFWRWLRSQSDTFRNRFVHKNPNDSSMNVIWDDRRGNIEQLQSWLVETADTFIIVQGPRGSGKKELVMNEALKRTKHKLVIDCKPIQEARGDSSTIRAAAQQVGYRPVFSFMNTVSGWVDLAAQGTTGVKTGFSETMDTQLQKIFINTATALKEIALEGRGKTDADAHLSDDEYLEAHPEKRAVVVVDNFLHKSQESTMVYDKIAEWSAGLTTGNIAHIIFLTNDVSFSKSLSKALPDRVFRQMSLTDSSPDAAKRFVLSKLAAVEEEEEGKTATDSENLDPAQKTTFKRHRELEGQELDDCIDVIGGRLTDLEFLARRIKMGESPYKAMREIVNQSASEILKMYLYNQDETMSGQRRWTPMQAWTVVKQLAMSENATLRYNEVVLDEIFKSTQTGGPDQVLQALEQAELISVAPSKNGRPQTIRPGKPVYHAAFKLLTEDKVLQSRLDLAILGDLIKVENATISTCETELRGLAELPKRPWEVVPRMQWLLKKIQTSQANIEKWEIEQGALKSVLKTEY